ncbi:4-hydroxy-tetrahydrodipicolinate synthase [Mesorhizobium sp. AR10]|uniref:4-hydroxy-tetrahydrodipicolinate synthase n=1 Tax=Mesorhizobium sp. AR10 TaxID=2865839 RepID=UPI00215F82AD|nr:4-hydroxy-tetrahydrodipicolinate synthase [Mesorhizobium sp. AR10]UVK38808.1 4-hydroxy-tetrahydrodipicolinate synthase [Mesorhizobium sp. AR10]
MTPEQARVGLNGAMTALVTPFSNGEVDLPGLTTLLEWQIEQGIDGLVPCGTTGEAPTLSWEERLDVLARCVKVASGRVPVIAGTGTNNTEATVAFTTAAEAFGADAALIVTPYYNRPTQEGIYRHFEAIARKVRIPIIVYNVPARTGVDLSPETIERLAQIPTIIGIKDATGDLSRPSSLAAALGERFIQFSGHDSTSFGFNTMGGRGTISVVSNVAPRLCVEMHDACRAGDHHSARAIHHRLRPLIAALELESNPIPVKYALHLALGLSPDVRLPLTPVQPETASAIREAMLVLAENDSSVFNSRRAVNAGQWWV